MLKLMKFKNLLKLAWGFLPEVGMMLTSGLPKLILLVEFSGNSLDEIDKKMDDLQKEIKNSKDVAISSLKTRKTKTPEEAEKYWTIRRESFSLLRKHVQGRRTAPFIDDVCVRPEFLPDFLPKLRKILDEYKLIVTIAGHAGNGNFHIIPLMDMTKEENRKLIPLLSDKVYDLVAKYEGTITAEHNDGLIRTPYLGKMFKPEMLNLFSDTKKIFDPHNIFNPNKKVGATVEYMNDHLAKS
jgi:FAD/FMN-containing dehydrogenase